jgi:threonine synthase
MASLTQSGGFTLPAPALERIRADFAAGTSDEAQTAETMRDVNKASDYLADPHTAVGIAVARRFLSAERPMVTLSTAHPAKFPDAVEAATGVAPQLPLWLADLPRRPERCLTIGNDVAAVQELIAARSRAWEEPE